MPTAHTPAKHTPGPWSATEQKTAIACGWLLAQNEAGLPEIQRHDESARFSSDDEALFFVRAFAEISPLCAKAIKIISANNPAQRRILLASALTKTQPGA